MPANRGAAESHASPKHNSKFAYIKQLPALRAAAYKHAKTKWDSGTTAAMIEGSQQYDAELIKMCEGIANRYYPKNHFGPGGIRKLLKDRIKATGELAFKINDRYGDGGGTINSVLVEGDVSEFLEGVVRKMVAQVSNLEDEFDFQRWELEWNKCASTK